MSQMNPTWLALVAAVALGCGGGEGNAEAGSSDGDADAGAGASPARQPALDLYANLYQAIREGTPQAITPLDVRERVAILEKARLAAGRPLSSKIIGRKQ